MFQKNILLFFLWFLIFLWFITFSFQNSNASLSESFLNSIISYNEWFSEFSSSWNIVSKIDENTSFAWKNLIYKDSILNNIYSNFSTKSDLGIKTSGNIKTYYIKPWIYLFDINDKSFNYEIKSAYFSAKFLSSWKVFIDNRDIKSVKIFSFDSILNFSLSDEQNKENYTNLYIYPHMYFSFNSLRNFYLKNADLFRISIINNVSYIKEQVYTINREINNDFLSKINISKDEKIDSFLKTFLNFISKQEISSISNLDSIKNSQVKWITWKFYIESYALFLYNDEKKLLYYKNSLLQKLKNLLETEKLDNSSVSDIVNDLDSIKDFSSTDYQAGLSLINWFYKEVLNNNSFSNFFVELNYQTLLEKISSNSTNLKLYSYLNSLYWAYDTNQFDKSFFYYFSDYINNYLFKEFSIEKDENWELFFKNKKLQVNLENAKLLNYFSFLLYNIIYNSRDLKDNFRDDLLENINDYVLINNLVTKTLGDDKRTLAQLYYNNDIARKILLNFKDIFFENMRDENKLLVLKTWVLNLWFTNDQFSKLELFFKLLSTFYTKNLTLLDITLEKDKLVDDSYKEITSTFLEYIIAAKDYETYTLKYDEIKKWIIWLKTITQEEDDKNYVFNRENFINYINQFNWVDVSDVAVTIESDYYHIENLKIFWNIFSFDLYPNNSNRISNIKIWGSEKNISYKLDSVKENWEDQYKNSVEPDEKDKYDFKNFFVNTFLKNSNYREIESFNVVKKDVDEDRAIVIIKKDKLLWEKWEFSIIKDILPVKYENINIVKNWKNYDISLNWLIMNFSLLEDWNSSQNLKVEFSSNYIFTSTEHKFTSIKIKFLDDNAFAMTWEKVYLFNGKTFDLPYNLDIKYFADRIKPIIRKIYNKEITK